MTNKAKNKDERAAAHREAVSKSYRRKHDINKEKARLRMAEKRKRLKEGLREMTEKKPSPSPDAPAATHSDVEDGELTDIDQAVNNVRFSSPAQGSISGEEVEYPQGCSNPAPDDTRLSSAVSGSASGKEEDLIQDDQGVAHASRWDNLNLPGLSYDNFPVDSVLEQISYDLDEEEEIAGDLLGSKGVETMIEYDTREMERLSRAGVRLWTPRK